MPSLLPVASQLFNGLNYGRVKCALSVLNEAPVRHLMCQCMLEGELALREKVRLVEKL